MTAERPSNHTQPSFIPVHPPESLDELYPIVPNEEIAWYEQSKDQGGIEVLIPYLIRGRNEVSLLGRELVETVDREPQFRPYDWTMGIETENGHIGIWHADECIRLSVPKTLVIPDELILDRLGLEYGVPGNATTVVTGREGYDEDKQIDEDIGYKTYPEPVLWSTFCTPRFPNGGRVWVEYGARRAEVPRPWGSRMHTEPVNGTYIVRQNSETQDIEYINPYNYPDNTGIETYFYPMMNKYSPDAPIIDPEAILTLSPGFIQLAAEAAFLLGTPQSISVDFGDQLIMVPQNMQRECSDLQTYVVKSKRHWDKERLKGTKGASTLYLTYGDGDTPWSLARHDKLENVNTPQELIEAMVKSITI